MTFDEEGNPMKMKCEIWNKHSIRFVEKEPGEWWAVAVDVAEALEYRNSRDAIKQHCPRVAKCYIGVQTGIKTDGTPAVQTVEVSTISERDIYRLIFRSNQPDHLTLAPVREPHHITTLVTGGTSAPTSSRTCASRAFPDYNDKTK